MFLSFITVGVDFNGLQDEADIAQAIRLAKADFNTQLHKYVTDYIRANLQHIKIPAPKAAN